MNFSALPCLVISRHSFLTLSTKSLVCSVPELAAQSAPAACHRNHCLSPHPHRACHRHSGSPYRRPSDYRIPCNVSSLYRTHVTCHFSIRLNIIIDVALLVKVHMQKNNCGQRLCAVFNRRILGVPLPPSLLSLLNLEILKMLISMSENNPPGRSL